MMDYAMSANPPVKTSVSFEQVIYKGAITITGLSIAYLLSVYIVGHSWLPYTVIEADSSELMLSLIQCLLGVAALHVPNLLTRLTQVKFPDVLCAFFYVFVICGTVFGEMFSLFYAVPFWDSLLHFDSGVMTGMLGSILLVTFLESRKCGHLISPMFVAIASVCFAICIGVFWEFYEFAGDNLLGLNMQKCLLQDGSELIGRAALFDTMKDLIVDTAGAIIAAIISFISLKRKAGWLHTYRVVEIKTEQRTFSERQAISNSAA